MTTTINADTSIGIKITSDTSGVMGLQTAGNTAITIDGSQNVGIGTTTPDIFSRGYGRTVGISDSGSGGAVLQINSASGYGALELGRGGARKAIFTAQSTVTEIGNLESVPLTFITNSTERMRVNAGAPILCLSGGSTTATGTGIAFPATQSSSSDANTLDDYEEGTFTPTVSNFTVSGTTTVTGAYTKIGRMVFVSIKFENTGTIAFSTSANISLPFAIPTGALPTGGIVMYVNNNSESFTSGKNGTQHALDTEGGARFFPGSFTTTSAGQQLFFSGFYRTST
jgi:hypothetical protein